MRLTESTAEFLSKANIKELYLIGGSAVISENVEKELKDKGIKITRISGTNRADTSRLIAERYFPATSTAFVANGFSFADGLAAAPYAAKLNAPVLLVGDKAISSSLINHLKTSAIKSITVVGGDGAVGPRVLSELRDAIK
ncbi:MAG: hypothetical protein GX780_00650 [Campylobacteraceae bacterium]|nr:hypothetical protein [Campylobacteraceae bacterium]